jgi:membrane peptidoglycan carboxypeptidase
VRRTLYVVLGLSVLGPLLAFVIGWIVFDVPSADDANLTQVATFTYADGSPLATVRPDNVNRVTVTLDQVPEHVQRAVLSAEDRSFFSNPGFDVTGIARAFWNQLTGGSGGGSTITQQYIKVSTGQDDFSLWRKYKEFVLAAKISREQTKEEILENYLNVIYLGRGAYGVQAASQAYFGKGVEDLTVSEGAMLAGIIQSPSRWDPAKNPDRSVERWNFVLDGMVAQNWLSAGERAEQQFPDNWLPEAPSGGGIPGDDRGHIYNLAKAELEERGITEQEINTQGLTILTTIDPAQQQQAVDAVTSVMEGQPENLRSALVSVDPRTGALLAYYGGPNGVGNDYAQALRQPGSSFKPFVLAAALQGPDGIGLGTTYDGSSPQEFPGGVTVRNSEGFDCAECTVQTAMTRSINTVFYQMALDVGPAAVIDAAHRAGIPADLLPEARGGIALGDQEVHPIDMASAFATFAANGMRYEPHLVVKVTASDGRVLYDRGTVPGEQVLPQDVARNVTESMRDVASSSGIGLAGGRDVAVKTGTVQHPTIPGQNKDAWTVGYTPSIATAVWVGSDASDPIQNAAGRPVFGRMLPGAVWQAYMNGALRGTPAEQFSRFVALGDEPRAEPVRDADPDRSTTSATSAPTSPQPENTSDPGDGNGNGGDGGGPGSTPGPPGDSSPEEGGGGGPVGDPPVPLPAPPGEQGPDVDNPDG